MRRSSYLVWLILLAAPLVAQAPRPPFRIAGTIVNALTGQPLAQAQLTITHAQSSETLQTVNSDDAGKFQLDVAEAGKYVLVGQARGFGRQSLDEHGGFSTAVVVGPDKDSESVLFRLFPDASISGTITDESNEPVREAQVMLFHRAIEDGRNATHLREQVRPDDQGHYRFSHLATGTYFVTVSARPWYAQNTFFNVEGPSDPALDVTYPVTYYSGATDSNAATPITLKPGDRMVADIGLAAIPTVTVAVSVPGATSQNAPIIYFTQHLFGDAAVNVQARNQRFENGEIHITGVPPGQLELNVVSPKDGTSTQQPVSVSGNTTVQFKPGGSPSISGTVSMGGRLVSGGFLTLTSRSGGALGAQINDKGSFQVEVAAAKPGAYEVAIFNVPDAAVGSVSATGARVVGRSIEIPESGSVQLAVTLTKGLGRIDGIALRDGKPMAGAMIVLVPQNMTNNLTSVRRDQSDSDGTFTLPQILPGAYTVIALQNGWDMEWQNPSVLAPYLKSAETIEIAANQRHQIKVNVQ